MCEFVADIVVGGERPLNPEETAYHRGFEHRIIDETTLVTQEMLDGYGGIVGVADGAVV